jgi:uncharacterized protein YihD (DUF1040 family)
MKLFGQPPRNPERITEVLKEIESVWRKYPDARLYQLLSWFESEYQKKDKFYVEEDELLAGIQKFKKLRGIV